MISGDAALAMTRFGTGYRPDLLTVVAQDPKGWLKAQLSPDASIDPPVSLLPSLEERWKVRFPTADEKQKNMGQGYYHIFIGYTQKARDARIMTACRSSTPLRERLVRFFFEHFTVSVVNPRLAGVLDIYEAEAIRPHATGRFRDLLGAVIHHPMMQTYLDNQTSVGPNSVAGKDRGQGLNENLGRELLELHTLGVSGGYTQDDVRAAAKILTGWSMQFYDREAPFALRYMQNRHEPGDKVVMGRRIAEAGEAELEELLDFLAQHEATAHFISYKLAKYFIADHPPDDLVRSMAETFLAEDGRIDAVMTVLIDHPESWRNERQKVLLPEDWAVACGGLFGLKDEASAVAMRSAVNALGHLVYAARSPKGWPDDWDTWFSPGNMVMRAAVAAEMYQKFGLDTEVDDSVIEYFMGGNRDMIQLVKGSPTKKDAFAVLVSSPQFNLR